MDFEAIERSFQAHTLLGERGDDGIFVAAGEVDGVPMVRKEVISPDQWTAQREVIIMRLLQIQRVPDVLRLVAFRTMPGRCVMYMPYWEGGDLLSSLEGQPSRWPMRIRMRIWTRLLRALDRMHEAGVAHRDIKAENVLVRWFGETPDVCFADFGMSTTLERRRCSNSGTLTYAAPEILTEKRFDLVATDVWAMGVLLFLLLYSDMPFSPRGSRSSSIAEISNRIRRGDYAHPPASTVPRGLADLVDRMLDPVPGRRPRPAEILGHPALCAVLAAPQLLPMPPPTLPYAFVAYRSSSGSVDPDEYEACLEHEDERARPPAVRVITPPGS